MARPTKLDSKLHKHIIKLLKTGATVEDVCEHVGIAPSTFYDWMKRGAEDDAEFSEFSEAVNRARNAAKITAIGTIRSAMSPYKETSVKTHVETRLDANGKPYPHKEVTTTVTTHMGDWRAAETFLKRRHPNEWGDKTDLTSGGEPLPFVVNYVSPRETPPAADGGA